jgi:hypothetical protein
MKTPGSWILGTLAVTLLMAGCGRETSDEPTDETVVQRLDNAPGDETRGLMTLTAEPSGDGTHYCAVGKRNLCAPAVAGRLACRPPGGPDCTACCQGNCICCEWEAGSWPFRIRCGPQSDWP